MLWDEDYEEKFTIEDIGNKDEDLLMTIEYIEDKNERRVDDMNYINNFVEKVSSHIQSIQY